MSADIFIISEDVGTVNRLRYILEAVGYDIAVFPEINSAIESLDGGSTLLVFVDTEQAGSSLGEEITRLQERNPNIEVILMAEFQDPLNEDEARRHGVKSWLYRPFDARDVILKVASALEMASSVGPDGIPKEQKETEKTPEEKKAT